MDAWMDAWVDGWMDGWMHELPNVINREMG